MAAAFTELMSRLGYDRYGVHGNDGGAIVSPEMGRLAPDKVIGVHVDQIFSFPRGEPGELEGLSEHELMLVQFGQKFLDHAIHDSSQRTHSPTPSGTRCRTPRPDSSPGAGGCSWIR